MSPPLDDWPELDRLLDRALELPPERRQAFADALPPAQAHLASQLRAILEAGARRAGQGFLERLPLGGEPGAGARVGPWALLRPLGQGGMGAVWLAERADGGLARKVALKLPRAVLDPAALVRRMARERDTLAALEHPNIARLYDAGVDEAGRPWLAMEYVDGEPLDAHADARGLGVRARLALFLQVADAVACAHARLVVHRDLKPGNVLVTAAGDVRLLDFGIAKLLEDGAPAGSSQTTELAGPAFTPDYAAPEQLAGGPITVATDVHALGVLLHELLAGSRPYTLPRGHAGGLAAAREAARPPAPSEVAPASRRAALRGDLDVIVAKAMRLDPAERYASVAELAADLRRHLAGDPVLARPPGLAYRAGKFVRRHRLPVALAAAVALALAAGVGATLWQARRALVARDRAEALLARTTAVGDAMDHLVQQAAAELDPEALARVIGSSASVAQRALAGAPDREALVVLALAGYLESANDRAGALRLLDRAGALAAKAGDPDLSALVACRRAVWAQDTPEAAGALDGALARAATAGLDARVRLECQAAATLLAQHERPPAEGLALARGAERLLAGVAAPSPRLRALVRWRLGEAEAFAGEGKAGRAHLEEALAILGEAGLDGSSDALQVHHGLSELLMMHGVYAQALPHVELVLASFAQRTPPDVVVANLGFVLEALGRPRLALAPLERAAALARQAGNAWAEAQALAARANVLRRLGRLDEARRSAAEAERAAAGLSAGAPALAYLRFVQGVIAVDAGDLDAARRHAAALFPEAGEPPAGGRLNAFRLRALIALAAGDLEAARADAGAALVAATERRAHEPYSLHTGRAHLLVAEIEERAGRRDAALAAYREARAQLAGSCGEDHPDARAAGEALARLGGKG
ncbi:MAG: serine/threonine-protein kinase [Anaeromyxobacter sp.]